MIGEQEGGRIMEKIKGEEWEVWIGIDGLSL